MGAMCWMVGCWYMVNIGTVQLYVPLLVRSIFLFDSRGTPANSMVNAY